MTAIKRNVIEHACVNSECGENVKLEWDNRRHVCKCGRTYSYNPTGGATGKVARKKGTDWLVNNKLRAKRS